MHLQLLALKFKYEKANKKLWDIFGKISHRVLAKKNLAQSFVFPSKSSKKKVARLLLPQIFACASSTAARDLNVTWLLY